MDLKQRISRRSFMRTVVITAGAVGTGFALTGCDSSDDPVSTDLNADSNTLIPLSFNHGVASGDPLSTAVILWTRVTPEGDSLTAADTLSVTVQVAADESFSEIVASGTADTHAEVDFTVKFDVTGLQPARTYYYRFIAEETTSPVGQTKTLPEGAVTEAKLAVVSCSNYPAGFFNVFDAIAQRDDLDALVHLGDYLYEYPADGYASEQAETLGRVSLPAHELLTLGDYRTRYAQYHTDPQLQSAHARLPFILVWDDHEVANDAWTEGAENHDDGEGSFASRKAAAIQAWYEWLPVREPESGVRGSIYRRFEFGDLLTLLMLDTRHEGRDQALDYANYLDSSGAFDSATFTADLTDANRQLLGSSQTEWVQQGLTTATSTWQVLGQQVLLGRMEIPSPLLLPSPTDPQISFSDYGVLLAKAQTTPGSLTATEQAILAAPSIAYNLDAWDGYFVQRETLLGTSLAADCNLVVLSGDTHNAWANDLKDMNGVQVGVEFATASVSSPGLEAILTDEDPAVLAGGLTQLIAPLQYCNTADRGYLVMTFSETEARGDWYFVDTIQTTDYQIDDAKTHSLKVLPGAGNRSLIAV